MKRTANLFLSLAALAIVFTLGWYMSPASAQGRRPEPFARIYNIGVDGKPTNPAGYNPLTMPGIQDCTTKPKAVMSYVAANDQLTTGTPFGRKTWSAGDRVVVNIATSEPTGMSVADFDAKYICTP